MIWSSIHLPVNLGNSHRSCPQFGYRFLHWCSQTMYCLKRTNSADEIWQWWKFCEGQETVMWSCLRLESKQDSRLSSGKKHQVDFQSSRPVISWGCLGVMHSFCAEGDESSHEGRAFRWRGFADSNLWSRSDYQWLIHNQSIRWPQWSWSPHAQPPVVIAILPYPLVGSAKKITILVAGGNKFST